MGATDCCSERRGEDSGSCLVHTRRDGVTAYYRHANEHVDALVGNVLHQAEHLRYDHPPHHS